MFEILAEVVLEMLEIISRGRCSETGYRHSELTPFDGCKGIFLMKHLRSTLFDDLAKQLQEPQPILVVFTELAFGHSRTDS